MRAAAAHASRKSGGSLRSLEFASPGNRIPGKSRPRCMPKKWRISAVWSLNLTSLSRRRRASGPTGLALQTRKHRGAARASSPSGQEVQRRRGGGRGRGGGRIIEGEDLLLKGSTSYRRDVYPLKGKYFLLKGSISFWRGVFLTRAVFLIEGEYLLLKGNISYWTGVFLTASGSISYWWEVFPIEGGYSYIFLASLLSIMFLYHGCFISECVI